MKLIKGFLFVVLCTLLGLHCSCDKDDDKLELDIELNNSSSYYENMYYVDAYNEFRRMGFNYIEYDIIYDLEEDSNDFGKVYSVSINKDLEFNKGDNYSKYSDIVITYHSFISKDPSNNIIEDNYDINYSGDTYRVNFVIDFNTSSTTNKYNMEFRIDGHVFNFIYFGVESNFELDLKPGKHIITLTKEDELGVFGKIDINIDDDMIVNYNVTLALLEINIEETNINKDAYCVVNFNSNGGNQIKPLKIKKGQTIYGLSSPTGMDDYRFKGWEIEPNIKMTYPYIINKDLTLTAVWKPKSDYVYEICLKKITDNGIYYVLIDLDNYTVLHVETAYDTVKEGLLKEISNNGYSITFDGHFYFRFEYLNDSQATFYMPILYPGMTSPYKPIYDIIDSEEAENYLVSIGYLEK